MKCLLGILVLTVVFQVVVYGQSYLAWSAYTTSACTGASSYDFMVPLDTCLSSQQAAYNPFNYTAPYIMMTQSGQQIAGIGCNDSKCSVCNKPTEQVTLQTCQSGEWVANTTAFWSYSMISQIVPTSSAGGMIVVYYAPSDTTCTSQMMGATIQENGVCTNGMLININVVVILKKYLSSLLY